MVKTVLAAAVLMVAIFVLAGCRTASVAVDLPPPVKASSLAFVNFGFILVSATNSAPDLAGETSLLQDSIVSGLRETSLFPEVEEVNTNGVGSGGAQISASIKQITKVSKDSREWFGGLAGKALVVVQVTISDLGTGKLIEKFETMGETSASARAGTTEEAIQRAAAKIVAEMVVLNSQAAQDPLK